MERLNEKVLLGDGAIGTFLYEKGIDLGTNTDLLNLSDPDLVYSVHEEYIRAGSELIETNTFGANRYKLHRIGQAHRVAEINRKGAELASRAAGTDIFVAGSVGPTGIKFPLEGEEVDNSTVEEIFREQMTALLEGGIQVFMLETFTYLDELIICIKTAGKLADYIPVVAQMTYPARGRTAVGNDALLCAEKSLEAGASVVGTNCGRGVRAMLSAIDRLSVLKERVPLSAFPNAGIPEVVEHRMVYSTPPAYMADKLSEMVKQGVRLLGGCCGTTPSHIHAFRERLHLKRPRSVSVISGTRQTVSAEEPREKFKGKGGLLESFVPGRVPVLVELDPPSHLDLSRIISGAMALSAAGADAITLAENPLAVLRSDNLSLAHMLKKEIGIQTVLHLTCRDRNVLGLQTQITGAYHLGLEAILAVTGDPATSSDQPGVSGVFDVNSLGLVRMIDQFNRGFNFAGSPMGRKTNFSIGVAFSYRPKNPDLQIRRLERKAAQGAHFVMTQPLFDRSAVEEMADKTKHLGLLIFPGIFPLISARNADFLHNEVPGISIPGEIRKKLWRYDKVADQKKAALEITGRLVEDISKIVDGYYIISPLNKWDVAELFVRQIREAGWTGSGLADKFAVSSGSGDSVREGTQLING